MWTERAQKWCKCGGQWNARPGGYLACKKTIKAQNTHTQKYISKDCLKLGKTEPAERARTRQNTATQSRTKWDLGKVEFIPFTSEVINCSVQTDSRREMIHNTY